MVMEVIMINYKSNGRKKKSFQVVLKGDEIDIGIDKKIINSYIEKFDQVKEAFE